MKNLVVNYAQSSLLSVNFTNVNWSIFITNYQSCSICNTGYELCLYPAKKKLDTYGGNTHSIANPNTTWRTCPQERVKNAFWRQRGLRQAGRTSMKTSCVLYIHHECLPWTYFNLGLRLAPIILRSTLCSAYFFPSPIHACFSFRFVSFCFVSSRLVSSRFVSFRFVSFRFVSFLFVSFVRTYICRVSFVSYVRT